MGASFKKPFQTLKMFQIKEIRLQSSFLMVVLHKNGEPFGSFEMDLRDLNASS